MNRPCPFQWTGEVMQPTKGFIALANKQYVVGEVYTLSETDPARSMASHRHYFAAVYDAWLNLPEHDAERYPSADHLRKYALIRAGYRDERSIVCSSKAEAQRIAAFIKPLDDFALVAVSEAVVRVYTAKSQNVRAMGRKVFQESKEAVLGIVAGMIEVSREQLLGFDGRDAAGGSESSKPAARAA